jgi:hypothetical protein
VQQKTAQGRAELLFFDFAAQFIDWPEHFIGVVFERINDEIPGSGIGDEFAAK